MFSANTWILVEVLLCLSATGAELWRSGKVDEWYKCSDRLVRGVAKDVNGPLLVELANYVGYHDTECIDFFRSGAALLGKLPVSGNGTAELHKEPMPIEQLHEECEGRNAETLARMRQDKHDDFLFQQV